MGIKKPTIKDLTPKKAYARGYSKGYKAQQSNHRNDIIAMEERHKLDVRYKVGHATGICNTEINALEGKYLNESRQLARQAVEDIITSVNIGRSNKAIDTLNERLSYWYNIIEAV